MSNLVVIEFDDEQQAFEMRAALAKMQKEYLIQMKDIVVVTKNEKGKIRLHQAVNLTAAGAIGDTFWGMLIGMIFFNPLLLKSCTKTKCYQFKFTASGVLREMMLVKAGKVYIKETTSLQGIHASISERWLDGANVCFGSTGRSN